MATTARSLFLSAILACESLQAQVAFGVKGGPSLCYGQSTWVPLEDEYHVIQSTAGNAFGIGLHGGVSFMFGKPELNRLQVELLFDRRITHEAVTYEAWEFTSVWTGGYHYEYDLTLTNQFTYMHVPILLSSPASEHTRLLFGLSLSQRLGGSRKESGSVLIDHTPPDPFGQDTVPTPHVISLSDVERTLSTATFKNGMIGLQLGVELLRPRGLLLGASFAMALTKYQEDGNAFAPASLRISAGWWGPRVRSSSALE